MSPSWYFSMSARSVKAVGPCVRHEFYQVMVALVVFCEHNEVVTAHVLFAVHVGLRVACDVHLAPEYWLECEYCLLRLHVFFDGGSFLGRCVGEFFLAFGELAFCLALYFVHVVEEFLYPHHVAMVGNGHSAHAVLQGLVHEFRNACLAVEDGVLGVYVQVYEVFHFSGGC